MGTVVVVALVLTDRLLAERTGTSLSVNGALEIAELTEPNAYGRFCVLVFLAAAAAPRGVLDPDGRGDSERTRCPRGVDGPLSRSTGEVSRDVELVVVNVMCCSSSSVSDSGSDVTLYPYDES